MQVDAAHFQVEAEFAGINLELKNELNQGKRACIVK